MSIAQNSPAASAGLQVDDVITEFTGVPVRTAQQIQQAQRKVLIGNDMTLRIRRDGKSIEIVVRMGAVGYTLANRCR